MFKKVLISAGVSMALLVGAASMNCTPAYAVKADNAIHTVKPFYTDKLIKMLKDNGKIQKNATQDQIDQILAEYIDGDYKPMTQQEKAKKTALAKKYENFVKVQETQQVQTKSLLAPAEVSMDKVQPKEWNGSVREDELLTILIEYKDYKHNQLKPSDTDMYYKDFNADHYQELMFGENGYVRPDGLEGDNFVSMKQYYEQQSGGSFTFKGTVIPWVVAEHDAAYYGSNPTEDDHSRDARSLAIEAIKGADAYLKANGKSISDFDKDKDGVPDHIAIIYAGMGEEAGGGPLEENAIWSHSSSIVVKASDGILTPGLVVPYVMMPEDGAAGVFCHEFGHQLGLPDEYDTKYSGRGEAVSLWSIMADGSWAGLVPGTEPTGFSPKNKEFFQATMPGSNWQSNSITLDYSQMAQFSLYTLALDQASSKGQNYSTVRINLPDKKIKLADPAGGKYMYYSGDNQITNPVTMTATVDLKTTTTAALTFMTRYDIEQDYDLATVSVRPEGSSQWINIPGTGTIDTSLPIGTAQDGSPIPNDAASFGRYGFTGSTNGKYINSTFDLTPYVGKKLDIQFKYTCDSGVFEKGMFIDNIAVTGDSGVLFADDVEGTPKFALTGFTKIDGNGIYKNCYYIEWRNHQGVDMGLKHRLYNGQVNEYAPGMVVWYADDSFSDNYVGTHPGEGYIGVVDADQTPSVFKAVDPSSGLISWAKSNIQIHDAAFSLRKSAPLTLTQKFIIDAAGTTADFILTDNDVFMNPVFDDSKPYIITTNKSLDDFGRKIPANLGLKVFVSGESKDRSVGIIKIVKMK